MLLSGVLKIIFDQLKSVIIIFYHVFLFDIDNACLMPYLEASDLFIYKHKIRFRNFNNESFAEASNFSVTHKVYS